MGSTLIEQIKCYIPSDKKPDTFSQSYHLCYGKVKVGIDCCILINEVKLKINDTFYFQ